MHPKTLLLQHGIQPKKSLGQNFLYDDGILAAITTAGELEPDDNVLEVGSGLGALTRHLADSAGQVVAVELDDRLLPLLQTELAGRSNVRIVHGNILEQDPVAWFGRAAYKVVANVPYYITGAILRHLLSARNRPTMIVMTVQREVAQRLAATPNEMSLLAVSVQCYGDVEILKRIKAGAFWPRPEVDSAIIRIDLSRPSMIAAEEERDFFRLVRTGFSQKRKQMQKNLRGLGISRHEVQSALAAAGIEGHRRAETLSMDEWTTLLRELSPLP